MQRITVIFTVAATIAAIYFGRPRDPGPTEKLISSVVQRFGDDRAGTRVWMHQLPANTESAEALLHLVASGSNCSASALHALHALLDRRVVTPQEHDSEFVIQIARSLATVGKDLPIGAAEEVATRLLEWPDELGLHGPIVVESCAAALQSAALQSAAR